MIAFARFALHIFLALVFVCVAVVCVPLARVNLTGSILWALAAHEHHLRRALEIARGED